jgi:DNA ligase (NAD+)
MPLSNVKIKKNTKRVLITKRNNTKKKPNSKPKSSSNKLKKSSTKSNETKMIRSQDLIEMPKKSNETKKQKIKIKRTKKIKSQDLIEIPNKSIVDSNETKKQKIKIKIKRTKKIHKKDLNIKSQDLIEMPKKSNIIVESVTVVEQPTREKNIKRLNETYTELMLILAYIMRHNKDFMRARAYNNAHETISTFVGDITSPEQLKGKKGIGNAIYQKLIDYNETGTLSVIERNKDVLEKKKTVDVFSDIYGVGEKKAEELADKGIKSITELEKRKDELLNDKQKIGLKYYNDILQRIPRDEIVDFEKQIASSFPTDDTDGRYEIVGSYRRGLSNSGDIDIIITSKNPNIFKTFIDSLIDKNIIIEVLSRGKTKCLVIAKLPYNQYARRVDFLYASPDEFAFSILYFTGSKGFNTTMRERALNMGYTLNEHGFSKMENRKKGDKLEQHFPTEKSIFEFLKMDYKLPTERIDSTAVVASAGGPMIGTRIAGVKPTAVILHDNTKPSKKVSDLINDYKNDGIKILEALNVTDLKKMMKDADIAFHLEGSSPIMSDAEYDILDEFIKTKYPNNDAVEQVGAVVTKNKATLPYEMWSMDKIKPDTGILTTWTKEYLGKYVISAKLDGVSGLYTTEGDEPKLYTRGNGTVGQDVSHLIPKLRLPTNKDLVIRGEFIIKKGTFKTKYADKFSNPRNMVAGVINKKTHDERINDIDFVAYEVIKPANLTPGEQMDLMASQNVHVVRNETFNIVTNEMLSELLVNWRTNHDYEIDGIIVANNKVYPRVSGNPKHTFAFKMVLSDQISEAHVVDVIWSPSKYGYLKPRVQIMPIKLGGVTIQFATGFNAKFIEDNKIGVGAIIQLIRSGDVIPKIEAVTQPAENAKMPKEEYTWNETRVDIMVKNADNNSTVRVKNIAGFFKGIEVDGLGDKNVEKIINAGYNSVPKIIKMTQEDYLGVEGFKEKTATKLYDGIKDKILNAPLHILMGVSNIFGRGLSSKKIGLILTDYPNVLDEGERNLEKLLAIRGIEKKSAETFLSHIDEFIVFIKECGLENKLKVRVATPVVHDETHPLFNKSILFTGFRDKDLEIQITSVGGKIASSISKNTFAVLVKNLEETSGKVEMAKKLGIVVLTKDVFIEKYL